MVAFGVGLGALVAFHQFKLPPVLPALLQSYDYDRALAGGFMSIYAVAGLLLSLPLGRLIDRCGAGRFIHLAFALLIAASVLAVAAPASGLVMLGARGLEGVAFAVCAIIGPAFANLSASPRHLPLVAALTATWVPIGQLVATLFAPVALAVGRWWWLWAAGLLATLAMARWTRALERAGRLTPPGIGAGGGPEDRARRTAPPPWSRPQRTALILAAATFMLWSVQYFAYMTWLPQYLVEVHGLSEIGAIAGYTLPVAVLLAVNLLTGLALRAGVPIGPLLAAAMASQAAVWWLVPVTSGPVAGIASLIVYGIGAGIVPVCLFGLPGAILGGSRAGPRAFAVLMTGRNMGVLVGPVLLAAAYEPTGSWAAAMPIIGAATTVAAVVALYFAARRGTAPRPH